MASSHWRASISSMYAVTHLAFFECVSTNDRYNNPGNEMDKTGLHSEQFWTLIESWNNSTECQRTSYSLEHEHDDLPKKQPGYTGLGPSNPPLHVWYIRRANHSLAHPRRLNYTSWSLITSERTTIVTTRGYTTRAACHVALVATWKVPCWTTLVTTVAWYNLIGTH